MATVTPPPPPCRVKKSIDHIDNDDEHKHPGEKSSNPINQPVRPSRTTPFIPLESFFRTRTPRQSPTDCRSAKSYFFKPYLSLSLPLSLSFGLQDQPLRPSKARSTVPRLRPRDIERLRTQLLKPEQASLVIASARQLDLRAPPHSLAGPRTGTNPSPNSGTSVDICKARGIGRG